MRLRVGIGAEVGQIGRLAEIEVVVAAAILVDDVQMDQPGPPLLHHQVVLEQLELAQ